jgi:hypothetical protein
MKIAIISIFLFISRTLTSLDLECCNLTEYAGQLFLTLFTKYPVKLEEIYLDKNSSILESTRTLINECLNLKSRQNSISSEQLLTHHLSINDDDSTSTNEQIQPIKLEKKKKKKKKNSKQSPMINIKEEIKSVQIKEPVEIKKQEKDEEEEIEELLPVEIEPHGTVGPTLYWNRV